jgi:hypothetical protein
MKQKLMGERDLPSVSGAAPVKAPSQMRSVSLLSDALALCINEAYHFVCRTGRVQGPVVIAVTEAGRTAPRFIGTVPRRARWEVCLPCRTHVVYEAGRANTDGRAICARTVDPVRSSRRLGSRAVRRSAFRPIGAMHCCWLQETRALATSSRC